MSAPQEGREAQKTYRVDATYGTPVRVGQPVGPGDLLGLTSSRQEVRSGATGRVASVEFDPSIHAFLITIDHPPVHPRGEPLA